MKKIVYLLLISTILFSACENTINLTGIQDVGLKVSFDENSTKSLKLATEFTYETPENYFVALKKATLKGINETQDFVLFDTDELSGSFVFDYTDDETVHSLLQNENLPDGEYNAIELEIYYLEMNIKIARGDGEIERRNIRIYLSDDAETENGLHQPGDLTQINEGVEVGWLLGEGQEPNLDPVSPRTAAYSYEGNGTDWYDFAGKSGEHYGPFGDVAFMESAPHPVYSTTVYFNFAGGEGENIIIDFNVNNCWVFEDKHEDGAFGYYDLLGEGDTKWHMELPIMTVSLQ